MRKMLIILILFNFVFMKSTGRNWSDEAKTTFYLSEKLSPEKAVIYQSLSLRPFTNLGYAYSDNWKRGRFLDAGIIMSAFLYDGALDDSPICETWGYECDDDEEAMLAAQIVGIGLSIYKFIDVYMKAEKYNNKLYRELFGKKRPYFSLDITPNMHIALHIPINS